MLIAEPTLKEFDISEMEAVLFLGDPPVKDHPTIAGVSRPERALRILLRSRFAELTVVAAEVPRQWRAHVEQGRIRVVQEWKQRDRAAFLIGAEVGFGRAFPTRAIAAVKPPRACIYEDEDGIPLALIVNHDSDALAGGLSNFSALVERLRKLGSGNPTVG